MIAKPPTKRFLEEIIPQGYVICLATQRSFPDKTINTNRSKQPWRHHFYSGMHTKKFEQDLERFSDAKDTNTYVAVGGYDNSKRRKAENVKAIRCLLLDIDLHDTDPKFFHSKGEAISALKNLLSQVPFMPRPWIVDSGNGVHVYFSLGADLTVAKWAPLATLFANVVRALEPRFLADPVRTKDAASVMRMPGTWNAKQPVSSFVDVRVEGTTGVLEDIKEGLARSAATLGAAGAGTLDDTDLLPSNELPSYMVGVDDSGHVFGKGLEDFKEHNFEDLPLRPIVMGCKQMHRILGVMGNVPEPEWVLMLRVLASVKNAADVACKFSSGHPTYNEAGTRRKLRHIAKNFEAPTAGCSEFEDVCAGGCAGCPSKGKIWTPSQLALRSQQDGEIKAAQEEALESAEAGAVSSTGHIAQPSYAKQRSTDMGKRTRTFLPVSHGKEKGYTEEAVIHGHVHLCHSTVSKDLRVVNGQETMQGVDRYVHFDLDVNGDENHVSISAGELSNSGVNQATQSLRTAGLPMDIKTPGKALAINRYIGDLATLSATDVRVTYPTKGWVKTGPVGNWGFIAGCRRYHPNGHVEDNISIAEHWTSTPEGEGFMERNMTGKPKGKLNLWRMGMDVYSGNQYVSQLLLLSGLSNLLLPLLTENKGGIVLALTGESGRGKTTLLRFMASFMGFHRNYILPGSSTPAALGLIMQQANCMLLPVDDTVTQEAENLSTILNLVSGGSDKARMKWDSKTGGSVSFNTGFNASLILTSNYSQVDTIGRGGRNSEQLQTEAARTRTLEIPVEKIVTDGVPHVEWLAAVNLIGTNHGHAAHHFLKYIIENQKAIQQSLRSKENEIRRQLAGRLEKDKAGTVRFWAQYLAVSSVTAYIVCHKLGLLPWDHLKIRDAGLKLVGDTLAENQRTDSSVVEELRNLLLQEPYPNEPTINVVRKKIVDSKAWPDWEFSTGVQRTAHSDWEKPGAAGDATYRFHWRIDIFRHGQLANAHLQEVVAYIPISRLRTVVDCNRKVLGVTGLSDLHRSLIDGGCVVFGMENGKMPKKRHGVRINQTGPRVSDAPVSVVEIRFPPETVTVGD